MLFLSPIQGEWNKEKQWNHGTCSHFQKQYKGILSANTNSLILPGFLGSSSGVLCSMFSGIWKMLNHSCLFSFCSKDSNPLNTVNVEIQTDTIKSSTVFSILSKVLLVPNLFLFGWKWEMHLPVGQIKLGLSTAREHLLEFSKCGEIPSV